jgi:hypothetical protein
VQGRLASTAAATEIRDLGDTIVLHAISQNQKDDVLDRVQIRLSDLWETEFLYSASVLRSSQSIC